MQPTNGSGAMPHDARDYQPIGAYGVIGSCGSFGMIATDGSIDWLCFRRFDAASVFGRLLDKRRGGYFRIAPRGEARLSRRYLPDTNVLETRFATDTGVLVVTDCLPVWDDERVGGIVREKPEDLLIRSVRCESGEVDVVLSFYPRFNYGLTTPMFHLLDERMVQLFGGANALRLQCGLGPLQYDEKGRGCRCEARLKAGQRAEIALVREEAHLVDPKRLHDAELRMRVERTVDFWQRWSARCEYSGPRREVIVRSMLVLKALTYEDTGAIAAAGTTSLPEDVGGVRNWDYRFSWLRDSGVLLHALGMMGYVDEARGFGNYLLRTCAGNVDELQILYGVGGERLLPESELPQLEGWRGSRPVRIGNAAYDQFQMDTYGELVSLTYRLSGRLRAKPREAAVQAKQVLPTADYWLRFIHDIADTAARRWPEPDDGIWESRGGRQHFVFSKVMAWVALDRAAKLLGDTDEYREDAERWNEAKEELRRDIETKGFDAKKGAFVQAYGSDSLDATGLQLVISGFLSPDDPRARSTVEAIDRELSVNGHVYRYLDRKDGLPGGEATFIFCTLWLSTAYAMLGDVERAQERLELVLRSANDLGLLAEEIDANTGELIGNFPQAFSHAGLVQAITAIDAARAAAGRVAPAPIATGGTEIPAEP